MWRPTANQLTSAIQNCSRWQSTNFFYFIIFMFRENKDWYFIWIRSSRHFSWIVSPIFVAKLQKKKKEKKSSVVCCCEDWHFNLYHSSGIFSRRQTDDIFFIFPRKQDLTFHANCLLRRQFAWNVKFCFLGKIRKNISKCRLVEILPRVLSVKGYTAELQWLEHVWDHRKLFQTWIVGATEG